MLLMLQILSRIFRFPQWMKIIPDLDAIGNGAQKTSSGHSKDCLLVDEVIPARSLCSLFKVPPFDEAAPETFFTIPAVLTTSPLANLTAFGIGGNGGMEGDRAGSAIYASSSSTSRRDEDLDGARDWLWLGFVYFRPGPVKVADDGGGEADC